MYNEIKYVNIVSSQLSQFKKKGDYLWNFRCPYCGDSQKSSTKARGFIFKKEQNLVYKCHNCGVGKSLKNFLDFVDSKICKDYILETYKKTQPQEEEYDIGKFQKPRFLKGGHLTKLKKVSSLRWDHPVKKWVDNRKIPTNRHFELFYAPKFFTWVNTIIPNKFPSLDGDHPRLVIPFLDEDKNMFALQGRAFGKEKPKYITINLDEKKDNIYGLHRLQKDKLTYVVEGPIDSLFLDNCIAVAGADFKKLDKENKVIIFDNERRSVEILKRIREIIDLDYKVVLWPDDIREKDINDMILSGKSKHDVMNIISKNTFSGNMARMKFAIWRKRNA